MNIPDEIKGRPALILITVILILPIILFISQSEEFIGNKLTTTDCFELCQEINNTYSYYFYKGDCYCNDIEIVRDTND